MKTYKKLIVGSFFLLFSGVSALYAGGSSFSDFSRQVLGINARPGYSVDHSRILILHPMVKDREVIMVHESKLNWQGNSCTRTIVKSRQLKGKRAKGSIEGKTVPTYYIPKKLKEFLTSARISNFKKSGRLKLDKRPCPGYSFTATVRGVARKGAVFINPDGSLKAISFGFPEAGISHARNMKDSGTTWYFTGRGNNMRLVKRLRVTTKKSRGIPVIKVETTTYSRFR